MPAPKGNKNALGNSGKPAKYKDEKSLVKLIDDYFDSNPEKPTISGLAHHLGFVSRQSIYDYEKNVKLSYIIKSAVLRIESLHEQGLFGNSNAGHIFWLKNRGWKDTQYVEDTLINKIKIVKASESIGDTDK